MSPVRRVTGVVPGASLLKAVLVNVVFESNQKIHPAAGPPVGELTAPDRVAVATVVRVPPGKREDLEMPRGEDMLLQHR